MVSVVAYLAWVLGMMALFGVLAMGIRVELLVMAASAYAMYLWVQPRL